MSKKNKFDLTNLVHAGYFTEGSKLYFVSDTSFWCTVKRMPNHEYKVEYQKEIYTIHAVAQKFLGTEPPEHASRWLRSEKGDTLYQLWQLTLEDKIAA
jgi:hypothetical protein